MTMATEPADDDEFGGVFGSEREDRGGKEPAPVDAPEGGQPRDESGRFAAKTPDPEPVQAQEPAEQEESPPDQNANRHVPLSELLSERKLRQEKERLLIEAEARAKAHEQLILQSRQQAAHQPQQQFELPDPYTDPEGYVQFHLQQQALAQRDQVLDAYEDSVRTKHGDAAVDAALQAARQTGVINQLVQTRNPWRELMRWHKDVQQRAEVGDDLEAFKKRIADEAVAKALASLRTGGNGQQQPARFPGTLATATATGSQGAALTDEAVMSDVFGSGRRSRRQ